MLHLVYFMSLVDLENKCCVRVLLVNAVYIIRVPAAGFEYFRILKSPSNVFGKWFVKKR